MDPNIGGEACGFAWSAFTQGPNLPASPDGGPGYVQVLELKKKMVAGTTVVTDTEHQTRSFMWSPSPGQTHQVTFE
jgi:hypothetical protein